MKVIFEITGGWMDGLTVCNDAADQREAAEADGHYFVTDNGALGRKFWVPSPGARRDLEQMETKYGRLGYPPHLLVLPAGTARPRLVPGAAHRPFPTLEWTQTAT
jgi:hypothetical protein